MPPTWAAERAGEDMVEVAILQFFILEKKTAQPHEPRRTETKAKKANFRGPKSSSLTRPPIARLVRKPSEQCPQKVL